MYFSKGQKVRFNITSGNKEFDITDRHQEVKDFHSSPEMTKVFNISLKKETDWDMYKTLCNLEKSKFHYRIEKPGGWDIMETDFLYKRE